MENQQEQSTEGPALIKGLPMFTASAPEALAKEKAELVELATKPILTRWRGYFGKTGPGWMQSALTLGGGSAMASLFAGAFLQYKLLWVQPIAMLLGVIMYAAISHQTLSTGVRPFDAVKKFVHPSVAWLWVLTAILVTIIWHIPQYALAAGMTDDIIKAVTGWQPTSGQQILFLLGLGVMFLVISTAITWGYSSSRGVRIYERILKCLVWMIVVAFAVVVVRMTFAGKIEWGKVAKGFLPLHIPTDRRGISVVMGAFGAAIGVNATFLFPYTLLARGWGREHRGLSVFDLIVGMLIPYSIATALMIIAAGCTIYSPEGFGSGATMLSPTTAATMFESAGLGVFFSRVVFGLGIIGMALSTITLHMLICGFAACEIFKVEPGGWHYRLACLVPAPAMAGVVLWKYMGPWVAVPVSAICGLMLPIAYIAFFILHNSSKYLGDDKPRGKKAVIWNIAMLVAILVSVVCIVYYLYGVFGK